MKIEVYATLLLIVAGCHIVSSQSKNDEKVSPPSFVFASPIELNNNDVLIGWVASPGAISYTIRIYRQSDGVLVREIRNMNNDNNIFNETHLAPSTNFSVTVASTYFEGGIRKESSPSTPVPFTTNYVCGPEKPFSPCNGAKECEPTCSNPDPICSRVCVPGCLCPAETPIWHNGLCIPRLLCPRPKVTLVKPTRLIADPAPNGVNLLWEMVENAEYYVVKVKSATTRKVEQSLRVDIPRVLITGLTPGESYIFSVRGVIRFQSDQITQRTSLLSPSGIIVGTVTDNSFSVSWNPVSTALRYYFIIYGENQTDVLYSNGNISSTGIDVVNLAPGTIYYFSVASIDSTKQPGIFSPLQGVRTSGKPVDTDMFHAAEVTAQSLSRRITTTPQTTTVPMTLCRQRYASVASFYKSFPNEDDGPPYPNCDEQGRFVTRVCGPATSDNCYCVEPDSGNKIEGSEFGGSNSAFDLNCSEFGSLDISTPLTLQVSDVQTNSLRVTWNRVSSVLGYVIYIKDESLSKRTVSVNALTNFYTVDTLVSGRTYTLGIYAVDDQGWTSPMTTIQVTTALVDKPSYILVTDTTPQSITVAWTNSPNAESYNVRLVSFDTNQVLKTYNDVNINQITIDGLTRSTKYIVEVRAMMKQANHIANDEPIIHMSDAATVEASSKGCALPPMDILFAFDISGYAKWAGLRQEKDLAVNVTLDVPDINQSSGTRVAAIKYYNRASRIFDFNRFSRRSNLIGALRYLRYYGGYSSTLSMLEKVKSLLETRSTSSTRNATSVTIIMSADLFYKESTSSVASAAKKLHSMTNVIAVGVANRNRDNYLSTIASSKDLVVTVPSAFTEINQDTFDKVMEKICSLV